MTSIGSDFREAASLIKQRQGQNLEALLEKSPKLLCWINPDERDDFGYSLLHVAAAHDSLKSLELLLSRGAPVNIRQHGQPSAQTPLHFAASLGFLEAARRLCQAGADVSTEANGTGGTALTFALFYGHREAARFLSAHCPLPKNLRTAAGLGQMEAVEAFFGEGGLLKPEAGNARGFQVPHDYFGAMPGSNDPGEIVAEALHYAARNENMEVVRFLRDRGTDINHKAHVLATPLHFACAWGKFEAVRGLLGLGADRLIRDDRHHALPYGWALHAGWKEIADYLYDQGGIPLRDIVANGVVDHLVRFLDREATDLNQPCTPDGEYPLLLAVRRGQAKMVERLLACGADIHCRSKEGKTARELAATLEDEGMRASVLEALE